MLCSTVAAQAGLNYFLIVLTICANRNGLLIRNACGVESIYQTTRYQKPHGSLLTFTINIKQN